MRMIRKGFGYVSCGENIFITKMTDAWNDHARPYRGGKNRIGR